MTAPAYLRDAAAIYARSFALVREAADLSRFDAATALMVERIIHACGMPDITGDIIASADVMTKAAHALGNGAPVLCDCSMLAAGITRRYLPCNNRVVVTLHDERTAALARDCGTTRSAAATELWRDDIAGAVVAIGNAPTALFHLLDNIAHKGWPPPAAICAFPVGFVGAAESKTRLAEMNPAPFITLAGRRGGSAMAAAAVNAAAVFAEDGGGHGVA